MVIPKSPKLTAKWKKKKKGWVKFQGAFGICAMVKVVAGDGKPPTFKDRNPYFMGPYKPLRTWVDEFIPYYMEIMGV